MQNTFAFEQEDIYQNLSFDVGNDRNQNKKMYW